MINELPNKSNAIVEDRKIREYLLNLEHPEGGGKANFFISKGFNMDNIEDFRVMLLSHAHHNAVKKIETNKYTTKYVIEGPANYLMEHIVLSSEGQQEKQLIPNKINLRTVWSIVNGTNIPKLVTAYPI